MKNLNIRQIGGLLATDVTVSKKFYMQVAGIVAVVILFICLARIFTYTSPSLIVDNIAGLVDFAALTYLSTAGAVFVSNIQHKRQRIAEFMLPASKLEKFLVRYVHLMILIPLAALIGIAVSDVLQMIISQMVIGDSDSILATIFSGQPVVIVIGSGNPQMLDNIIIFLFVNSLFMMVGTIFRRHAWIKSNIAIFTCLIILMIVIAVVMKYSLDFIYGGDNYDIVLLDANGRRAVLYPIALLLAALNYWLSYRIYSRMQITTNSWHNL